MSELTSQLHRILADYEARGRRPQMVLAVIAGLAHEVEEECGALPAVLERVQQVVAGWEQGVCREDDAIKDIAGLIEPETGRQSTDPS